MGADDCNGDNIPDKCQTTDNDCNGNGVPDDCDLVTDPDCNNNGILDVCDIASGASGDCQPDGIPDDCQLGIVLGGNAIQDPSFEAGTPNPFWTEASSNFGTPLCTAGACGTGGGTGPHTGAVWAWFGGCGATSGCTFPEIGSVEQSVVIPAGSAALEFFLEIPAASGNGTDFVRALIDGVQVFEALESAAGFNPYAPVSVDVSAFADGLAHTVRFESTQISSTVSSFFVDDVALLIQGSAGNDCNLNGVPDECDNCADLDGDGDADAVDYQMFRDTYGRVDGDPAFNECADYDATGAVGLGDFQVWLGCYRDFIGNPFAAPPVTGGGNFGEPVQIGPQPGVIRNGEFGQATPEISNP
jgi:hypothetical protein